MIKILYVHGYKGDKYGSSFQSLVKYAGVFLCERIFPATEVRECYRELGNGLTAICPYCGIDAVLADASGVEVFPEFLHKMHKAWFG